ILAACIEEISAESGDHDYLCGLIKTGEFFLSRMLPKSKAMVEEIAAGAASMMGLTAEQF
ncbi:MAG: hypothetical protein VX928_06110, partial [Pseudomonadota bacterium]|nr:hypothetical protein [Pseudomonadota bacterium]